MKIKVYFVLPTLFAGGAERVISFVAQNLNKDNFDVKLIVIGFEKDSKFIIDKIPVIYLSKTRVLHAFFPLMKIFINEKPNIVVSSISHLNTMMGLMSLFLKRIKFIGRHSTISQVAKNYKTQKPKTITHLFGWVFNYGTRKLDIIICQSIDMKNDFLQSHSFNPKNIYVIYNPITIEECQIPKRLEPDNEIKKLITIGRFRNIKGQLRLLDVLSNLKTPFKLTLIGEGEYKEKIFDKIKKLNLEDKINHVPFTNNVYDYLVNHDMFLQGSYSEGFPNTLLESCTVGTPVIAFEAPGGTREIIENGVNGYIVQNETEFLEKLKMNKIWDPKVVRDSVCKKFNKKKIIKEYEKLFLEVLKQ